MLLPSNSTGKACFNNDWTCEGGGVAIDLQKVLLFFITEVRVSDRKTFQLANISQHLPLIVDVEKIAYL